MIRSIISSHGVLKQLVSILGEQNVIFFPSGKVLQLIHLTLRTTEKIDSKSEKIVGVKGFKEFRMNLLNLLFEYSNQAPIAYIERVIENSELKESVIVLDKNRNIHEVHGSETAIVELFESGLIPISSELKAYIGPGSTDPKQMLKFRILEAKFGSRKFIIKESLPDIGWYLYVYESDGSNSYDYLQNTFEVCKRFANKRFDVPLSAWKQPEGSR